MKIKQKHAQSQIVSTVLLILITIVAAGLIMAFVIPFIKDKLPEKNENCLDIISKVTISSGYTCYNSTNISADVQIHIDDVRDSIKGFTIELGGASSKAVKVLEDDNSGVRMYGGGGFELPNNTEERTYIIDTTNKPSYIAVYPVLKNNKLCEASDTVRDVENC
jgi:flagellin-like protein